MADEPAGFFVDFAGGVGEGSVGGRPPGGRTAAMGSGSLGLPESWGCVVSMLVVEVAMRFAHEVVRRVVDAVGVVEAGIVHGSLAAGAFVEGRSDVDLLVVVTRSLCPAELPELLDEVDHLRSMASWAVDLRIVTAQMAKAPGRYPSLEFGVRISPGGVTDMAGQGSPEPDLLVEFATARAQGRSLVGPPPQAVISAVPASWIDEHGRAVVQRWQRLVEDDAHAELMVLTACRVWRFAVERVLCSKEQAGVWALERVPTLTAVCQSLRRREGTTQAVIDPHAIAEVLTTALGAVGHPGQERHP